MYDIISGAGSQIFMVHTHRGHNTEASVRSSKVSRVNSVAPLSTQGPYGGTTPH